MTNEKEYDLLIDIIKLIKKYGFETFEDLAKELSSPSIQEKLPEILSKTVKSVKKYPIKQPRSKKTTDSPRSFRAKLSKLKETEPEKGRILLNFYDDLLSKRCLPNVRDIENFISDAGLRPLTAKARQNAIIPFLKQLVLFEVTEIEKLLINVPPLVKDNDRSLAGWSDIILKKKIEID